MDAAFDNLPGDQQRTRAQEAYARLAGMARELGPDARMPTFIELKALLGVSVATLNKALSLLEAHGIVQRRHGVGIFVASGLGRKTVALVCSPDFFVGAEVSPFWRLLADRVRERVGSRRHGFTMHFSADGAADEGEPPLFKDFQQQVIDRRVHGVLGVGLGGAAVEWLETHRVPVVGFATPGTYRVDIDYEALVRAGVAHLAGRGCRRIAFWLQRPTGRESDTAMHGDAAGWETLLATDARVAAYRGALSAAGLPFDPALVGDYRFLLPHDRPLPRELSDQGYETARAYLAGRRPPGVAADAEATPLDGLVTMSELFTQGALTALEQGGIIAGTAVKVAAHANEASPVLRPWADRITRLEVSPPALAAAMMELLEARMSGASPPSETVRRHVPRVVAPPS